jgi:hypothetical protein
LVKDRSERPDYTQVALLLEDGRFSHLAKHWANFRAGNCRNLFEEGFRNLTKAGE